MANEKEKAVVEAAEVLARMWVKRNIKLQHMLPEARQLINAVEDLHAVECDYTMHGSKCDIEACGFVTYPSGYQEYRCHKHMPKIIPLQDAIDQGLKKGKLPPDVPGARRTLRGSGASYDPYRY